MIRADLHIHTTYSDGGQSPRDVVEAARGRGVDLISVTDHDNALAREEVRALAAKAGIVAVDGIEISAYDGDVKVHTLGYGLDFDCPAFRSFFRACVANARERAEDILKKLAAVGVVIPSEEVEAAKKCAEAPVHAAHIALAGVKLGYAPTWGEFYMRYLQYGRSGFSRVGRPSPEEAVELIVACGGFASLAHPGRISMNKDGVISLVERMRSRGLRGIEAVYSGHTAKETQYYKELAEKVGLLVTGGSDTHFQSGNRAVGTPPFYPDEKLLSALKIV